jgi:hypothetical protein
MDAPVKIELTLDELVAIASVVAHHVTCSGAWADAFDGAYLKLDKAAVAYGVKGKVNPFPPAPRHVISNWRDLYGDRNMIYAK